MNNSESSSDCGPHQITRGRFIRLEALSFAVELQREPVPVEVDLLAPEYGGRSGRHENQFVQDVRARKARGCDLVFTRS